MFRKINRPGEILRHKVSLLTTPRAVPRIIQTRTNGYSLLVRANEDVGRAIHFSRNFENVEVAFLRAMIAPDSCCFDIGANVGYFSMLMAQAAPHGMIHAFEPLPLNAALLDASIELNHFENIRLNRSAVGDHDGMITFTQAKDSAYSSIRDTSRKQVERMLDVPIVRLDSFCDSNGIGRIDVLKADVEGAEGMIIAGAAKILADPARRPRVMMIELYEPSLRIFDTSIVQILKTLADYGYRPHALNDDATLRPYDPVRDIHKYNIIFRAE